VTRAVFQNLLHNLKPVSEVGTLTWCKNIRVLISEATLSFKSAAVAPSGPASPPFHPEKSFDDGLTRDDQGVVTSKKGRRSLSPNEVDVVTLAIISTTKQ
jgi:hypothetical protein